MTPPPPPPPGACQHLWLLWQLRVLLARGGLSTPLTTIPAMGGLVVLAAFGVGAFRGMRALVLSQALADDPLLDAFLVLLVGFVSTTMWVTWPVLTATVDDAAELSRFAMFPLPPQRIFLASVLAALLEPRTMPVWGALAGAAVALVERGLASAPLALVSTLMLGLVGVVWGRAGLHALLHLLRQRRSAEAMGAGLVLLLCCAAFVPPPDLSWLREVAQGEPNMDRALLTGAVATFTLLPAGAWAWTLLRGGSSAAFGLAYLSLAAIAGHLVAFQLLVNFHRRAGRSLPQREPEASERSRRFAGSSVLAVLVERELRDLALQPRVRLMIALPFFLGILLKLVGARELATALVGDTADAWLLGGLTSYASLVLAAGLAQNAFGFDGTGATLLLGAPVTSRTILLAKNLAHASLALVVGAAIVLFGACWVTRPPAATVLFAAVQLPYQLALLIAAGNVLSVAAPKRFHASLRRRDRPAAAVTAAGLMVAGLAVAPGAALLRASGEGGPGLREIGLLVGAAAVALAAWWMALDGAVRLLDRRRPALLRALARQ
jgi:ABC-2 type transport system permease protein